MKVIIVTVAKGARTPTLKFMYVSASEHTSSAFPSSCMNVAGEYTK